MVTRAFLEEVMRKAMLEILRWKPRLEPGWIYCFILEMKQKTFNSSSPPECPHCRSDQWSPTGLCPISFRQHTVDYSDQQPPQHQNLCSSRCRFLMLLWLLELALGWPLLAHLSLIVVLTVTPKEEYVLVGQRNFATRSPVFFYDGEHGDPLVGYTGREISEIRRQDSLEQKTHPGCLQLFVWQSHGQP